MFEATANLKLPFLYVGQAQKEVTHNEALALLDTVLFPVLLGEMSAPPAPLDENDAGQRWLVGAAATGAWAGKDEKLACWTGTGWRFSVIPDMFRAYRIDLGYETVRIGGNWISADTMTDPTGGNVVDGEARASISAILTFLRSTGQIPDGE